MKCHLSDDLASDSEDEKQASRARREAAANKKKREANKQKDEKKQFWNAPSPTLPEKIPKSLANPTKDTVALGITQNLTKSVLPVDKKSIFNISAQIEEIETISSNRDWEISVRGRLRI